MCSIYASFHDFFPRALGEQEKGRFLTWALYDVYACVKQSIRQAITLQADSLSSLATHHFFPSQKRIQALFSMFHKWCFVIRIHNSIVLQMNYHFFSLIFLRFQRHWALINKLLLIWLFRAIAIIILKLCHVKISYTTHLNIWNISNDHEVQVM